MAHAAGDALDRPIYGAHYLVTFPIYGSDGNPVTGATGLDSEVSIDLGTFADCTNEATEIATNSGIYYLYLTGAEMTGKIITVQVKTTTSGAHTVTLSISPTRMAVIATGTAQAGAAGTITLAAGVSKVDNDLAGMYVRLSNNSPAGVQYATRRIISNVASTQVATVESAWGTNPSSATTYDLLSPVSANVVSFNGTMPVEVGVAGMPDVNLRKILGTNCQGQAGYVGVDWAAVTNPTTTLGLSGTTIKNVTDVNAQAVTIASYIDTEVAAIKAKTDNLPVDPADASDVAGAFSTVNSTLATIAAYVDTEVAAIKAKTDLLNFSATDKLNVNLSYVAGAPYDLALPQFGANVVWWLGNDVTTDSNNDLPKVSVGAVADDAVGGTNAISANVIAASTTSLGGTGLFLAAGLIVGSTGNTTTTVHLPNLTYGDDEINNDMLVIRDNSEGEYHSRWILDWVNATKLATVALLPFTPQNATDTYWILPTRQDVTGGSGLDAAGVRAAVGLASANLDTQLTTIDDFLDTEIAAIKAKTDNLPADPADASDIAALFAALPAAILDLSNGVETGLTPRQALRLITAALAGKISGAATTTIVIKNAIADNKNRITATVDASGNRSAITVDLT